MRIIAGRYRRRPLKAPGGLDTRPSTDRTRESLFSLVSSRTDMDGAAVLDLYAGSGALGIEALSRGANSAVFVESDAKVLRFPRINAETVGAVQDCRFVRADSLQFIRRYEGPPFDLVLADPPYESPDIPDLVAAVIPHVAPGGLFVLEHDARNSFDEHPRLVTSRAYGRTHVSIFAPGS